MPTLVEEVRRRGLSKSKIGLVSMRDMAYGNVIELQRQFPRPNSSSSVRSSAGFAECAAMKNSFISVRAAISPISPARHWKTTARRSYGTRRSRIVYNAYMKNGGDPGIHFIATTNMDKPDRFVPWQRQTSRVLERGSVVITELTVSYWGYSTQIHRPFAIGASCHRRSADCSTRPAMYENVRKICKPGTTSEQIVAATSVIEASGFTGFDSVFHGEAGKSPGFGSNPPLIRWRSGRWKKTWSTLFSRIRSPRTSQPACSSAPRWS